MNREEHLAWCKKRALEYLDQDPPDLKNALASLVSDLSKHEETCYHGASNLGVMLLVSNNLNTPIEMREFIDGVN